MHLSKSIFDNKNWNSFWKYVEQLIFESMPKLDKVLFVHLVVFSLKLTEEFDIFGRFAFLGPI